MIALFPLSAEAVPLRTPRPAAEIPPADWLMFALVERSRTMPFGALIATPSVIAWALAKVRFAVPNPARAVVVFSVSVLSSEKIE